MDKKKSDLLNFLLILVVLLSPNLIFIVPVLLNYPNTHLTLAPFQGDRHRQLYFIPANEYSHSGRIGNDWCIYENDGLPFSRTHLSSVLFGEIHKIVQVPVLSHLIGNLILICLILIVLRLIIMSEFKNPFLWVLFSAIFFLRHDPDVIRYYMLGIIDFFKTWNLASIFGFYATKGFSTDLATTRTLMMLDFFVLMFVFLSKGLSRLVRMILICLILGTSIYIHLYIAILLYLTMGLVFLAKFMHREKDWRDLFIAIGLSVPLSFPYLLLALRTTLLQSRLEAAYNYYILLTPSFVLPDLFTCLVLIGFIFLLIGSGRSAEFKIFFYSFIAATFISLNLHNITHYLPLPNNFYRISLGVVLPFVIILFCSDFLPKTFRKTIPVLSMLSVILLFMMYLVPSVILSKTSQIDGDFSMVLEYMKSNLGKSDVVLADYSLHDEILTDTAVNLYFCKPFYNSLTYDENIKRTVEGYSMLGQGKDTIDKEITRNMVMKSSKINIFGRMLSQPLINYPEQNFSIVGKSIIDSKDKYLNMVPGISYKLDYVLIRKNIDKSSLNGTIVLENPKFLLIKVKK